MARSKKRARRQSIEVFDFDLVATAMEATEEVTRAAIDSTVPDSQQATTGDISPTTDPTQPTDNARERPRKKVRSNPSKKNEGRPLTKRQQGKVAFTIVPDQALQPDHPTAATDGSSLPSSKNGMPLPPNAGAEAPTSRKGKEKMAMQPENAFEDEVQKELREMKEAITMSRREAKAIARSQKEITIYLGQSSAGPSNPMEGIDVHRGQPAASLQTKSALMAEYKNTVARMLEECERAVERNTSLEEELVIAQRKIDELE
ncbi:hypothetical protein R1flu_021814 [Riccia fluitans]|uniref:Uncharacterized protein n=1 Tax=Riccia fluitans TaxID=41844 RepID=A0ABD1ZQF6_9MARC